MAVDTAGHAIEAVSLGAPERRARAKVLFSGVTKRFGAGESAVQALERMDVAIEKQDFLCVVGPSGCGKSTLLNILAGFEVPSSGEVTLDGRAVSAPGAERGVVFQQGALFTWMSVLDNVAFGPLARGKSNAEVELLRHRGA